MGPSGYKQLIVDSCMRMLDSGYTMYTWGNISCLGDDWRVYITPSNYSYPNMTPDDVVVLDLSGNVLEGKHMPSTEHPLHCLIYRRRSDVKAILHTHPLWSKIFACRGEGIPVFCDEAEQTLGEPVICAPYAKFGTLELAENTAAALGETAKDCLLKNHGAICVGANMDDAFKVCRILEYNAELYWHSRALDK